MIRKVRQDVFDRRSRTKREQSGEFVEPFRRRFLEFRDYGSACGSECGEAGKKNACRFEKLGSGQDVVIDEGEEWPLGFCDPLQSRAAEPGDSFLDTANGYGEGLEGIQRDGRPRCIVNQHDLPMIGRECLPGESIGDPDEGFRVRVSGGDDDGNFQCIGAFNTQRKRARSDGGHRRADTSQPRGDGRPRPSSSTGTEPSRRGRSHC